MFDLHKYYTGTREEYIKDLSTFSYDMIRWKDHIPEFGDTRKEIIISKDSEGNEIVRHERFDGNVFQEGTPVDAENLGYMDYAIYLLWISIKSMVEEMIQIRLQMATILNQNQNNMPHNMFYANEIGEDLTIVEGYYDELNKRGVV